MGEGGLEEGGVRTTERLTSTQTSHAAAVWPPAHTANCHFAIGDACTQHSVGTASHFSLFWCCVQPGDN